MLYVEEEKNESEDADVEEEDRSRDRTARFVRAFAFDMHVNMSQTGWWFGRFVIFPYFGNNHPIDYRYYSNIFQRC